MKPSVSFGTITTTDPYWWGTRITDSRTTLPGGGMVDPATFTAGSDGKKPARNGTLVAKTFSPDPGTVLWSKFTGISDPTTVVEIAVILRDITDLLIDNFTALVAGNGANILYYNYLPEWASLSNAQKQVLIKYFILRRGLP